MTILRRSHRSWDEDGCEEISFTSSYATKIQSGREISIGRNLAVGDDCDDIDATTTFLIGCGEEENETPQRTRDSGEKAKREDVLDDSYTYDRDGKTRKQSYCRKNNPRNGLQVNILDKHDDEKDQLSVSSMYCKPREKKTSDLPLAISIPVYLIPHISLPSSSEIQRQMEMPQSYNKGLCLRLLETDQFDQNSVGMQYLVAITNSELVNCSQFSIRSSDKPALLLSSTIAYSLVYKSDNYDNMEFSKRLREVFPTFISDATDGSRRQKCHARDQKSMPLKLPALQALVSSLELVSEAKITSNRSSSSLSPDPSLDLVDNFWKAMLAYMVGCLQELVLEVEEMSPPMIIHERKEKETTSTSSTEAALVVKILRLLFRLDHKTMGPYIRYSLLPFLLHALEFGKQGKRQPRGDRMLVRECERLLKNFL